jgi:subtilase family serine protease
MAVQGQSMLAARGDAGSEQCLPQLKQFGSRAYQLAVGDPASQPYVTGVGGTAIVKYGTPPTEIAWNQTGPRMDGAGFPAPFDGKHGHPAKYPGNVAGNGGISTFWRMPSWQRGFDTSGNSSGLPCDAGRGRLCREVPDVSALAAALSDAAPGYAIYGTAGAFNGEGWSSFGGTSLATPLWAALIALIDQQLPGHRLGLLTPALYQIARADPAAFNDVTRGGNNYLARNGHPNNDTCRYNGKTGRPCYLATRGYDMATGLGSPRAATLAADLAALARAARR